MSIKFDPADAERVKQLKARMLESTRPFMHNTEAMLVAIAAAQLAREFLEKYPPGMASTMTEEVFVPFFRRETADDGMIVQAGFDAFKSLGPIPRKRRH